MMPIISLESDDADMFFAAEERIMDFMAPREPVWMLWTTRPTVMLGRNQIASAETDQEEMGRLGVALSRRASGGGAIYTDPGTLQYSVIMPFGLETSPSRIQSEVLASPVIGALGDIGIRAELNGRNDVTVGGKKISGLAQHRRGRYICSHGSLLYDTDLEALGRVLRPDPEKLASKAVASVSSRVTSVRETTGSAAGVEEFRFRLAGRLAGFGAGGTISFSQEDLEAVRSLRLKKYASPEWLHGASPPYTLAAKKRFAGGTVDVRIDVRKGRIVSCRVYGDYLSVVEPDALQDALRGAVMDPAGIRERLNSVSAQDCLGGVDAEELIRCIFGQTE